MGISPAGGDGYGFALRGDLLCPRRQSRQSAAGRRRLEKHSVFLCRLPRTPCFFYGGAIKGQGCIQPARAKDRIPFLAPPAAQPLAALPPYGCGVPLAGAAAPCWLNRYLLLQEPSRLTSIHRAAVRWLLRLRGWCWMCKNCREYTPVAGLHPPVVSSTAGLFRRWTFQVTVPWGYIQ